MLSASERAHVLIEALPYMQAYWQKVVVIKFGGSAMFDEQALRSFLTDVVFMEQVGMWPVLAHGGGPAISRAQKDEGVEPRFVNGLRVTDAPTLEVVQKVLIDEISARIVREMEEVDGRAIALNGRGSRFLVGSRMPKAHPDDPDLGFVGRIDRVDRALCVRLLDGGVVPVVAPIARDESGQLYNVNADTVACTIAEQMQAEKLIFLSNVAGILRDPDDEDSLVSTLHASEAREMIDRGEVSGGMIPKLEACLNALDHGVRKTHIVSGLTPHALLLEMFTIEGIGTQIIPD